MEITIAGAGAGKTTTMANKIIEIHSTLKNDKKVFCLAFTNNAVRCINNKLKEYYGDIPNDIIVSTIHSFLYREFIKPYYYLLYSKQYEKISTVELPDNVRYKNKKIKELDDNNVIHQTVFPERAKWVIVQKSGDRKNIKEKRALILTIVKNYIGAICIDEAQDIDDHMYRILQKLDEIGIDIIMMGDPKQDLRGYGNLRKLADSFPDSTYYIKHCHRCPQKHLDLSNTIVVDEEKQSSDKTEGIISIIFESEICYEKLLNSKVFDLCYISKRGNDFDTHLEEKRNPFNSICEEIELILKSKLDVINDASLNKCSIDAYILTKKLLEYYYKCFNKGESMKKIFPYDYLSKSQYAKIINSFPDNDLIQTNVHYVNSIDNIKGQEGTDCLFILTNDLAQYLLKKKTDDNKTKNKLYVALTRSLYSLTIFITRDVENKYGKEAFDFITKI